MSQKGEEYVQSSHLDSNRRIDGDCGRIPNEITKQPPWEGRFFSRRSYMVAKDYTIAR